MAIGSTTNYGFGKPDIGDTTTSAEKWGTQLRTTISDIDTQINSLSGIVVKGRGLGRKLGYRTANLKVPSEVLSPLGVFHVLVSGGPFRSPRTGVCNIGFRPTVGGRTKKAIVEVHIPGYAGTLYGKKLRIEFIKQLRGEKKFASLDALKKAIAADVESVIPRRS